MAETRTYLKLVFNTEGGGTHTISLRDPRNNLTSAEVAQVMQDIVSKNVILATTGELTGVKEAYISGTTVTPLLP
ncbi:MAG: DUF2922 domain-containing protein [Caldiserica bacterium]|jgi:hypothetical protein|nr:DUF2922 domain-containing protein [Caldisericota bacterium]